MILKNSVMFLLIVIASYSCSKKAEKPIVITHDNYKLYVYPENNGGKMQWDNAVRLCDNLVAFGYDDWYLPNIDELKTMYLKNDSVGGISNMKAFWSSTEYGNSAEMLGAGFTGEHILSKLKSSEFNCRCVRKDK